MNDVVVVVAQVIESAPGATRSSFNQADRWASSCLLQIGIAHRTSKVIEKRDFVAAIGESQSQV